MTPLIIRWMINALLLFLAGSVTPGFSVQKGLG